MMELQLLLKVQVQPFCFEQVPSNTAIRTVLRAWSENASASEKMLAFALSLLVQELLALSTVRSVTHCRRLA